VPPNRLFALMSNDEPLRVSVKMTDDERPLALELPWVRPAAYVGRYGWVTATVEDDEALDTALAWVEESWWLRAPARLRKVAP
jgi:predicted DNA-binding protein (MmcQ/YjbR family)